MQKKVPYISDPFSSFSVFFRTLIAAESKAIWPSLCRVRIVYDHHLLSKLFCGCDDLFHLLDNVSGIEMTREHMRMSEQAQAMALGLYRALVYGEAPC